jgi:HEAT repeat protein
MRAFEQAGESTKPAITRALATLGDPAAVSALAYALRDSSDNIRTKAAAALSKSTSPEALAALASAVKDSSGPVTK